MLTDMPLPKTYEPGKYEDDIYALWEKSNSFEPINRGSNEKFSIVLPPPNANGNLHVGHSLMFALQDAVVRFHRMKGKAVLWLPGADHAGFETQVVYEKQLERAGKTRFDFTREQLYGQIWEFVAKNRGNYEDQFRKLGASVDWSRFVFTLDDKIINQAYQTFKKMWDEDLIYRGERLVNFCTYHGTAFADIEVEYKNVKGKLYYIDYHLTDGSGKLTVATTRPETMLADVAVAVNPSDKRYSKFEGKTLKLPLTNREIPVISDSMVDQKFGTGAVKITPAHDPNDFEVAGRHDLPMISVIGTDGKMTHEAPEEFVNLEVKAARKKVVDRLEEQGYLSKTEEHEHSVGHCYKCGTVIEPLLREQWFVDMKPLAKKAIEVLKGNEINFYPASKRDQLVRYLQGLKDWNISRQIAWGIPIPAFQSVENPDKWIFDTRVDQEEITVEGLIYRRDPDVFDTWFSSSSWPYATLGYPDHPDFKEFYPNSLMETGGEILYPWVSRMVMMGLYTTGEIPFKDVYIHGYVLAEDGAKMSKSIGNVIDPMEVVAKYGSDALRMGLIAGRAPAINRGFDTRRVQAARNFANKLWNIARFIEGVVNTDTVASASPKSIGDEWLLTRLDEVIKNIEADLESYRFSEAYERLYHFVWDDFADWYIEASKSEPNTSLLLYALETILKIAHPFAPFVTETIWQTLHDDDDSLLIIEPWPTVKPGNPNDTKQFELVRQLVSEVRTTMTAVGPADRSLYHNGDSFIENNKTLIATLAKLTEVREGESNEQRLGLVSNKNSWLNVEPDKISEFIKKQKQLIAESEQKANTLKSRLSNKAYIQNAPQEIVSETKVQLALEQEKLANLEAELARIEKN